jgi:hypothetical protein
MIAQISEEMVWSQLVAEAWCDEDLMTRLLSDPRAVLAEHDLEAPFGTEVEVLLGNEVRVEETETVRRFILTAKPSHELEEEELDGGPVSYCYSGACGRCGGCGCRC